MEKSFDDVSNRGAQAFSCASSWENVGDVLEDRSHDIPEHKRISNIFPFFPVARSCNGQICNVAVLAASRVPAEGTVSATGTQGCRNPNTCRAADTIKNGIIEAVKTVLAARTVAGEGTCQTTGKS